MAAPELANPGDGECPKKDYQGNTLDGGAQHSAPKRKQAESAGTAMTVGKRQRSLLAFFGSSAPESQSVPAVSDTVSPSSSEIASQQTAESASNGTPSLERQFLGITWYQALQGEFSKPYYKKLRAFLDSEWGRGACIFPPKKDIFSWSRYCPLDKVKVVILGQDPYHNQDQAHGLCFSVRKGVPAPPSLANIFQELQTDLDRGSFQRPDHGCLTGWAKQGVLLLNAVLTVEAHKANSHQGKGWEQFTDAVIRLVADRQPHVVLMLWGSYAAKKAQGIDQRRHLLLKSVHPSPLSAYRGFFGCRHFSKCNSYLEQHGLEPIQWSRLDVD